eukprot:scaffold37158_cov52-Prasinocladus_malaysianus.AAC.4
MSELAAGWAPPRDRAGRGARSPALHHTCANACSSANQQLAPRATGALAVLSSEIQISSRQCWQYLQVRQDMQEIKRLFMSPLQS